MPKPYAGIGPRWLAWLMIGFAAVEVPWVVYLALFQVRTGTAYHTHLAAIGLSTATITASMTAAVGLWIGARWTPVPATMTATMLVAGGVLTTLVSSLDPVLIAVPGALAAVAGSYRTLRLRRFGRPTDRWLAAILALAAITLLARQGLMLAAASTEVPSDHLRALVVLLDTGEVVALAGAGLGLLRGSAEAVIFFGSAGIVLFLGDAWCNLVFVPSGQAFVAAVFYAVVGEIPSSAMCLFALVVAMRVWRPDGSDIRPTRSEALLP